MNPILSHFRRGLLALAAAVLTVQAMAAEPLRVFIRGGMSNRGTEVHAHPRFLKEWQVLLNERGAKATGAMDWPTPEQIKDVDVIVAYAQEGGDATPEQEVMINDFVKRGGGLVVLHTATVSFKNPPWWKSIIGGSWVPNSTKWREGPMDLYYVEPQRIDGGHPITAGASNYKFDDEIYYDMDVLPDARVLATSYTPNVLEGRQPAEGNKPHIYDIQPQMWVYEKTAEGGSRPYRSFVSIPGHLYKNFALPHHRAVILRGLAWAGHRDNLDEFCTPEELSSLRYPEGGPQKPAETLANLEVHPDFDMSLVVAEPLINKPMNFDWDASGRLWVAETPEYPNGRRGMRPDYRGKEWKDNGGIDATPGLQDRPARDKISILTDTDGDGVMDKKQIFFEGLDLVTGLVFYKDGVIVTQAPDILFLRDTDGDDRADKVETLYTKLGTGDTHAVINNPRWGWDGWIYATHGYSGSGDVRNGDGSKGFGGVGSGVVRFKPDGSAFEQYSSKGGNTWGLQITGDNRVMWTQPTSGELLMHTILPEYALARGSMGKIPSYKVVEPSPKSFPLIGWEQLAYVQIDWVGSFTAAAGTVVYDGGAWPAEYNGDYFTTEPTINVVHHARLTAAGSSYTASKLPGREETEFIRSKDMWWRPIEVRVGPDGGMYLADFYNQAVIHNDTRGPDHNRVNAAVRPDRDHYFGRIWKIQHKQAKKLTVPDLIKSEPREVLQALSHPNRHVRLAAHRLVAEASIKASDVQPATMAAVQGLEPDAKIAAMWTLASVKDMDPAWVKAFYSDASPAVRRNAALVAEMYGQDTSAVAALLNDAEAPVRLAALRALASGTLNDAVAKALIAAWPKFDDDYQKSAAIGAAARNPAASIAAALEAADPSSLAPLVNSLVTTLAEANDAASAATLVITLAGKPATADDLKVRILETLDKSLKDAPAMTPALKAALTSLLESGASGTALPLAAKWDAGRGDFAAIIDGITRKLTGTLSDAGADEVVRVGAARSLLGIRSTSPAIMKALEGQLLADNTPSFKQGLIMALGETGDAAVGPVLAAAYGKLPVEARATAFETLLKRADWAMILLDGVKAGTIDAVTFGPANAYRLRTHPAREVAARATAMKDELNPNEKAKNEIIAALSPIVSQPGNLANGKTMFTVSCATCHKLGDEGREIGPTLTGMGTHGPEELLVHIVDPNREVDPSFHAWNIETTDGQFLAGVIARQNNASVLLRTLTGEVEVPTNKIKTRTDTGRSLMPEGLDALGGEILRDILAYMAGDAAGKYRVLDVAKVATGDGRRGLFMTQEADYESVKLRKFGNLEIEGVPFFLTDPSKAVTGRNLVVLKGGYGDHFAQSFPPSVEIAVGVAAQRLHLLSGVAGWAWPYGGDEVKGQPAMKLTAAYADGSKEVFTFKNGIEFVDYIGDADVKGSKRARGLTNGGQIRVMTIVPARDGVITSLTVESPGNGIAPVIAAITAELPGVEKKGGGPEIRSTPDAAAAPAGAPGAWVPNKKKVLLIGGGSSHDFQKWYNEVDSATLQGAGFSTRYTEDVTEATALIGEADTVVYSTNQGPFGGLGFQAALRRATDAGTGLVLLHAGLWYNFADNQEYNRVFAGGGSRGHDSIQEFVVKISDGTHPVTAGLGGGFAVVDELYYSVLDPAGSPSQVLATATSPRTGKTFPSIWTVKHDTAKIAAIAAGHDARAHELPAFKQLLINAVTWTVK